MQCALERWESAVATGQETGMLSCGGEDHPLYRPGMPSLYSLTLGQGFSSSGFFPDVQLDSWDCSICCDCDHCRSDLMEVQRRQQASAATWAEATPYHRKLTESTEEATRARVARYGKAVRWVPCIPGHLSSLTTSILRTSYYRRRYVLRLTRPAHDSSQLL